MAKKYVKIGKILKGSNGKPDFMVLGNKNPNNNKYDFTVELVVKDLSGKVIGVLDTSKKDGFVNIQNPRKRPGLTEEQLEKIPERIRFELDFAVDE